MTFIKAFHLYGLFWKGLTRRVLNQLASEMVLLTCGIIIAGLFYVLVRDISLPLPWREGGTKFLVGTCVFFGSFILNRTLLSFSKPYTKWLKFLGVEQSIGSVFSIILFASLFAVFVFALLALPFLRQNFSILCLGLASSLVIPANFQKIAPVRGNSSKLLSYIKNPFWILTFWLVLGFTRQKLWVGMCSILGLGIGLVMWFGNLTHPFIQLFTGAWGLVIAMAYSFFLSLHFKSLWIEKSIGISHDLFQKSLVGSAGIISITPFLFSFMMVFFRFHDPELALMSAIICVQPLLLVPFMIFQIDGKNSVIQSAIVALLSFVMISATLMSWWGLIFWIGLSGLGLTSQKNRFYRT